MQYSVVVLNYLQQPINMTSRSLFRCKKVSTSAQINPIISHNMTSQIIFLYKKVFTRVTSPNQSNYYYYYFYYYIHTRGTPIGLNRSSLSTWATFSSNVTFNFPLIYDDFPLLQLRFKYDCYFYFFLSGSKEQVTIFQTIFTDFKIGFEKLHPKIWLCISAFFSQKHRSRFVLW